MQKYLAWGPHKLFLWVIIYANSVTAKRNMADEGVRPSSSVEASSSHSTEETIGAVTSSFVSRETSQAAQVEKSVSRKQYYKERDATRIYLFEQYQKWRALKEELKLKMDKELAAVLLEFYIGSKKCIFR